MHHALCTMHHAQCTVHSSPISHEQSGYVFHLAFLGACTCCFLDVYGLLMKPCCECPAYCCSHLGMCFDRCHACLDSSADPSDRKESHGECILHTCFCLHQPCILVVNGLCTAVNPLCRCCHETQCGRCGGYCAKDCGGRSLVPLGGNAILCCFEPGREVSIRDEVDGRLPIGLCTGNRSTQAEIYEEQHGLKCAVYHVGGHGDTLWL